MLPIVYISCLKPTAYTSALLCVRVRFSLLNGAAFSVCDRSIAVCHGAKPLLYLLLCPLVSWKPRLRLFRPFKWAQAANSKRASVKSLIGCFIRHVQLLDALYWYVPIFCVVFRCDRGRRLRTIYVVLAVRKRRLV
jgi:hypothetical protein